MYNSRIDERLSYNEDGCLPISRPFKCTHFFHTKRVTAWKLFSLDQTNKEKNIVSNEYFVYKSGLCDLYKDLYDHDWNPNGSATKSKVNARNVSDDVTHSVTQIQVRAPTTTLNFRDQQQSDLGYYEEKNVDYRNNQLLFQQFMLKDNHQSSPQSSKLTIKRSTRTRNSPRRLMDQQSHVVKSRAKIKPSSLVTCINDSSISVMTMESSVNKCHV